MTATISDFRHLLPTTPDEMATGLIGKDVLLDGPRGAIPMLYADYVASGRPLRQVEEFVQTQVLPFYANSHTEDSHCGATVTALRKQARAFIAQSCNCTDDHAVVFSGSGATAAVNRLVHLFGVKRAWFERPVTVLIGPYEHHSNILPWREAGAKVIEIAEAPDGGVDMGALDAALSRARGRVIGAFSAMSNVSGIQSDVIAVTRRLKRAGALAIWDFAGAGPYVPIDMQPAQDALIDAVVISPHKFLGGPAGTGLLVVRKDAVRLHKPSVPGGGTVRFVSSDAHDYVPDLAQREEGGTPNVIGDIRAGLAFAVKDALGVDWVYQRNLELGRRLVAAFGGHDRLVLLGNATCDRMPIASFRVRTGDGFYNYRLATRVLSDVFGIQARGGCSCAGPYVLRLLKIGRTAAEKLRSELREGDNTNKPGFVRLNLSYLMSEAEIDRVIAAVHALPDALDEYADQYGQDPQSGAYRWESALAAQ